MLNLDNIINRKLQMLDEDESDKDLNPFFVSKERVIKLLYQKGSEHQEFIERVKLLSQLFSLDTAEQEIILIVLAPMLDIKYKKIYAYLQDDLNQKEATVFLLSLLLDREITDIYRYLQAESTLTIFGIIERDSEDVLRVSDSVQSFLFGCYTLDRRISPYSTLISTMESQFYDIEENLMVIKDGLSEQKRFVIHLHGEDSTQKEYIATTIVNSMEYNLLRVDCSTILEYSESFDESLKLLFRESILSNSLLYFDNYDIFSQDSKIHIYQEVLIKNLESFSSLSFIASKEKIVPLSLSHGLLWYEIALSLPTVTESSRYWREILYGIGVELSSQRCDTLANLFGFTVEQIERIVERLKSKLFFGEKFSDALLYQLCRESISSSLKSLAEPLSSENGLDDIVLQKDKKELLKEVCEHYKYQIQVFEEWGFKKHYQSQGLGVLFTGASGTGKTMAASILANTLGLDLYRIELSRIVSKYIGETEKNLSKIFETAEGSGVILFFDEADAIFGKRTETKNSHDRYANIEVSYLLQKIEEYNGLVILASNFRQNIDEAFIRRMRFIINFPSPDIGMREEIWRRVFPKDTPIDSDIDFSVLAKNFELSGANIRNASLFSAFFAVQEGEAIGMGHIARGIKIELGKLGKVIKESNFSEF
ncbi:ATP-binding protein [Sulfurovum sp. bin170]|nr:ATP-binding protein [Sulfurovum sp. bin170]